MVARRCAEVDGDSVGASRGRRPVAHPRRRHRGSQSRRRDHRARSERASARMMRCRQVPDFRSARGGQADAKLSIGADPRAEPGRLSPDAPLSLTLVADLASLAMLQPFAGTTAVVDGASASRSRSAWNDARRTGLGHRAGNGSSDRRRTLRPSLQERTRESAHRESPRHARGARVFRRRRRVSRDRNARSRERDDRHRRRCERHLACGKIPHLQPAGLQSRGHRQRRARARQRQGIANRFAQGRRRPPRLYLRSGRDARRRRRRQRLAGTLARPVALGGHSARDRRQPRFRRSSDLRRTRARHRLARQHPRAQRPTRDSPAGDRSTR